MHRIIPIALLLILGGCAADSRARQAALNSTIGMDEASLIRVIGVPSRALDVGGHRFLAYSDHRVDVAPTFGTTGAFGGFGPFGFYDEGFAVPLDRRCETTYELDAGHVASWTQRGNACHGYGVGVPAMQTDAQK